MILKFILNRLSVGRQVDFMKKRGILLATRQRNGRHVYIYMFRELFAEIIFRNDNPEEAVEEMKLISGLERLNDHLKKAEIS